MTDKWQRLWVPLPLVASHNEVSEGHLHFPYVENALQDSHKRPQTPPSSLHIKMPWVWHLPLSTTTSPRSFIMESSTRNLYEEIPKQVSRGDFPPDFVFGVATSAFQVIWDRGTKWKISQVLFHFHLSFVSTFPSLRAYKSSSPLDCFSNCFDHGKLGSLSRAQIWKMCHEILFVCLFRDFFVFIFLIETSISSYFSCRGSRSFVFEGSVSLF